MILQLYLAMQPAQMIAPMSTFIDGSEFLKAECIAYQKSEKLKLEKKKETKE
jgi:hypothetical protein